MYKSNYLVQLKVHEEESEESTEESLRNPNCPFLHIHSYNKLKPTKPMTSSNLMIRTSNKTKLNTIWHFCTSEESLPEPSILNDGRIWKQRVSATGARRGDLPMVMEGGSLEPEAPVPKPKSTQPNRRMLPSLSAPEHILLTLLEECNAPSTV